MRVKPFSDDNSVYQSCYRCGNQEKVIIDDDECSHCYHGFMRSMISFEVIPIIEFKPEPGTINKKTFLIYTRHNPRKGNGVHQNGHSPKGLFKEEKGLPT